MRKLGRKKSNREHTIRNLATSLVLYETIDTTMAKAKDVKSYLEKVIARNKDASLQSRRQAISALFDKNASKKIIEELAPRYENRSSGFIRSYKLKNRLGDNALMMRLELVDKKVFVSSEDKVEKIENKADDLKAVKKTSKVDKNDK